MRKTYADIEHHARRAAEIARDPQALEDLKYRVLIDGRSFLRILEEQSRTLPDNRVATIELCYQILELIRLKPLEWFADKWDYDKRMQPRRWNGHAITPGMLGAAFLIKQEGRIGK